MMQECRIPLLSLVSMRGEWGEQYPWQVPMGQSTIPALEAAKVIVHHVDQAEKVPETVAAAAKLAFDANRAVAVVLSQRIAGSGGQG
jgi:sulfopyruvate decarboxylase TPP-binding subunit